MWGRGESASRSAKARSLSRTRRSSARNVRDDVASIVAIARERGARTIVVGDPLTLSGERGLASEQIDAFVVHLARAFDGEIARVDERLTTAAAQKALIEADVSRAKRKKVVDQLAAVGILETWQARKPR